MPGLPGTRGLYDEEVLGLRRFLGVLLAFCMQPVAQTLSPPAGIRQSRLGTVSILPGGRIIAPFGEQHVTGAHPIALALSPSGKVLVTINRGASRPSLTVMQREKTWEVRQLPGADLPGVTGGLAFSGEHSVFVSEGNTGRVSLIDLDTEERRRSLDPGPESITGDLVLDASRSILYVADLVHSRIAVMDIRSRQAVASIELEGVPMALALSPDHRRLYVSVAQNLLRHGGTAAVCAVDVTEPRSPRMEATIPQHDAPAGILAAADRVFISDAAHDSITVIDSRTTQIVKQIAIRIPGLEALRGILPQGMALDEASGWLLVAESGINAIGIIDTRSWKVLGHIPAGWSPTRISVRGGMAYVANEKGPGGGPNTRGSPPVVGSVSMFAVPQFNELPVQSRFVLDAAGLVPRPGAPQPLPHAIRHVVLIVNEGRTFDEILGDVPRAGNGSVMAAPQLARFGRDGYAGGQRQRLSLHHVNVTPNYHAIAQQWTFSDNFYAATDRLSDWSNLARHGVSFYQFAEPPGRKMSDTERARRAIAEIDAKYAKGGVEMAGLIVIRLANERMAEPDPESGFPYAESYVADNDFALGRLVEYFSGSRWWDRMALLVTEASAGGVDHIDAHRTPLLCAGPWARKNSVSHTNTGFAGLRKTIYGLLGAPAASLSDAAAADLSECFAKTPDTAGYRAIAPDPRLYRP